MDRARVGPQVCGPRLVMAGWTSAACPGGGSAAGPGQVLRALRKVSTRPVTGAVYAMLDLGRQARAAAARASRCVLVA